MMPFPEIQLVLLIIVAYIQYFYLLQTTELREKCGVIEHLRQSNVRVEEHLERSKHRVESLMTRLEETLSCLQHAEAKATRKDALIRGTVDVLIQLEQQMPPHEFVGLLRQNTVKPSHFKYKGPDFACLESLCSYIESEASKQRKALRTTPKVGES